MLPFCSACTFENKTNVTQTPYASTYICCPAPGKSHCLRSIFGYPSSKPMSDVLLSTSTPTPLHLEFGKQEHGLPPTSVGLVLADDH